jgi:hypothetical protein
MADPMDRKIGCGRESPALERSVGRPMQIVAVPRRGNAKGEGVRVPGGCSSPGNGLTAKGGGARPAVAARKERGDDERWSVVVCLWVYRASKLVRIGTQPNLSAHHLWRTQPKQAQVGSPVVFSFLPIGKQLLRLTMHCRSLQPQHSSQTDVTFTQKYLLQFTHRQTSRVIFFSIYVCCNCNTTIVSTPILSIVLHTDF